MEQFEKLASVPNENARMKIIVPTINEIAAIIVRDPNAETF